MRAMEIQGYRVLYFERARRASARPMLPREALACVSTHDLPTLRGWWTGNDIAVRERLGSFGPGAAKAQRHERERARRLLLRALKRGAGAGQADAARGAAPRASRRVLPACTALARTPSRLVAVQLEDLIGMAEQANLPGTIDEHPNWRRNCR